MLLQVQLGICQEPSVNELDCCGPLMIGELFDAAAQGLPYYFLEVILIKAMSALYLLLHILLMCILDDLFLQVGHDLTLPTIHCSQYIAHCSPGNNGR